MGKNPSLGAAHRNFDLPHLHSRVWTQRQRRWSKDEGIDVELWVNADLPLFRRVTRNLSAAALLIFQSSTMFVEPLELCLALFSSPEILAGRQLHGVVPLGIVEWLATGNYLGELN
jgi:hypothetical protein